MDLYGIDRHEVLQLAQEEEVERSLAEQLIKVSVYWYEHPCGYPVNAPGHVRHIYSSGKRAEEFLLASGFEEVEIKTGTRRKDWKVTFGANTFSISKAVLRCQSALIEFLDAVEQGNSRSMEEIKITLHSKVCQSVENYEGHEYYSYPTNSENHMIFGATSICVDEFATYILRKCQTFKKSNRQRLAICPMCMKWFKNKLVLDYHQQVVHYRRHR